ncbi:MAG: ribosome-binding factor A [Puniceicoccales bacterium]|jgi:ribosome-binding factor A|nr:ribosome-binding factor A [Puniceicoccales bacterium]
MSLRLNRINEAIEHEISRILRTYFRDETIYITIVGALASPDLKSACIKFSVIGDDAMMRKATRFFSKHKNFIKQKLSNTMQIRYTPELKFELTDAIAQGNHLIDVLNALEKTEM